MTTKTQHFFAQLLLCMGLGLGVISCSQSEDPRDRQGNAARQVAENMQGEGLRTLVASMSQYDPVAVAYCNNVKTIMIGTGALDRPAGLDNGMMISSSSSLTSASSRSEISTQTESFYEALDDQRYSENFNPMSLKLNGLNIQSEDKGKEVNFFDLPQEQKEVFVDYLLVDEAKDLSEKIAQAPELKDILATENLATTKTIEATGIAPNAIGTSYTSSARALRQEPKVDSKYFFKLLEKNISEEFAKRAKEQDASQEQPRSIAYVFGYNNSVPVEKVKAMWARYARRGDFILALPEHGNPSTLVNFSSRFMVGHAAILTKDITTDTRNDADVTMEAYSGDGVQPRRITDWTSPHYIMGIQRVSYRWKWRGFRSGLYRTTSPVNSPGMLADWAMGYQGREYVTPLEFVVAKWAAPKRFTCTTLVWWCSKKAYGINVSVWYSPLVSPSGLFTDNCTYVRASVR